MVDVAVRSRICSGSYAIGVKMRNVCCPNCNADISGTHQDDDHSVGIVGGWYCDKCDIAVGEAEHDYSDELDFE